MIHYRIKDLQGKTYISFGGRPLEGFALGKQCLAEYHGIEEDEISSEEDEFTGRTFYVIDGKRVGYLSRSD